MRLAALLLLAALALAQTPLDDYVNMPDDRCVKRCV